MKYIRTKDSVSLLIESVDSYIVKDSESDFEKAIDEETLLKNYKVADTIEELCDMFVIINEDWGKEPYCCTNVELKLYKKLKTEGEIYGAIWTDRGLIYVAKLDDKGDLKLL